MPRTDGLAPLPHASPARVLPPSRWAALRSAMTLSAVPLPDERGSFNLHAVLNLLNRLNGAPDVETREDLISRLADYLTALHGIQSASSATLSGLCELARSYAAMRYFMADAIEPRVEYVGLDLDLRTVQAAGMAGFLQQAVDTLLDDYIARVEISIVPRPRGWIEIGLAIERAPGGGAEPLPGWTAHANGTRFTLSARFAAVVRALPQA